MKKLVLIPVLIFLLLGITFIFVFLLSGNRSKDGSISGLISATSITVKGRVVDQLTGRAISGATVSSPFEFSPSEVISDSDGKFEFAINEDFRSKEKNTSSDGTSYFFYAPCYMTCGITFHKNLTIWENGQKKTYNLALRKSNSSFPIGIEENFEVFGESIVEIGELKMYPMASLSTKQDIKATMQIKAGEKDGGGNVNYKYEHVLTKSLPLDYDVSIVFTEQNGQKHTSSVYHIPLDSKCKTINLKYENGQSEWSVV